ncbi:MAG: GIY-YIG nuclease family protein [Patescibacteria group bacterium]
MYYCYILKLSNDNYYVGYSDNLKQRIAEHKNGRVFTTKKFLPAKLIYYAAFVSKKRALDFERYLKTNSGFAFRNKHLI